MPDQLTEQQLSELARKIADSISNAGLDFSGRFEDIETVLEIANHFADITIRE